MSDKATPEPQPITPHIDPSEMPKWDTRDIDEATATCAAPSGDMAPPYKAPQHRIPAWGEVRLDIPLNQNSDPIDYKPFPSEGLFSGRRIYDKAAVEKAITEFEERNGANFRVSAVPPAFTRFIDGPLNISLEPTPEINAAGSYPWVDTKSESSAWDRFAKQWIEHMNSSDPHPVPYKTVLLITMVQKRVSDKGCTLKIEGFTKCYPSATDRLKYDAHTVLLQSRRVSSRRLVGKLLARVTDSFIGEQLKLGISEVQQIWLFEENQIAQV